MRVSSTYRIQLHPDFAFREAAETAGYLACLGISHIYFSPYLQAVPGSAHGYDVANPRQLNAELGGTAGHARLVAALREAGLGQVLDIVPNHMAADPSSNPWWWDVLENGLASRFAGVFDVDWAGHDPRNAFTVLVPILSDHYGRALEGGHIRVERADRGLSVRYGEHRLPLAPSTLDELLARAARRSGSADLGTVADGFADLPIAHLTDAASMRQRHDEKEALKHRLAQLCASSPAIADAIDAELDDLNADADRLDVLLRRQSYRLAFWRTASEELDYRRFFNIETLVGVRVEDPDVFAMTHELILELVAEGAVSGLRIDHIDGLRDPAGYLDRLSRATGGLYTVVEKILLADEDLPPWPVAGTSGYDFLTRVNNLFVEADAERAFTQIYRDFTGETAAYEEVVHAAKLQILRDELAAELQRLTALLAEVCDGYRHHRDHTRRELREALRELVVHFPVYRTYVGPAGPASADDRVRVASAVQGARACHPELDPELFSFLGELAQGDHGGSAESEFAARLQQLTAPVMAKGMEDTAFYRYNRFVSLNEVGGDPGRFGISAAEFHSQTLRSAARWPATMLTLTTHDTKRSADARARLNALSEQPDSWRAAVQRWAERNERHRSGPWPDRNAEYLLYQSLVSVWPLEVERAVAFMAKATREAKVHTSWREPDVDYDRAVEGFVRALLADQRFRADLEGFLETTDLIRRGRRNSLAQTALLLTCPGVADVYQGSEIWDLSLVDPDNRRPVDFERRAQMLANLPQRPPADLATDVDGMSKLWLVHTLLARRHAVAADDAPEIYEPLLISGAASNAVIAFRRPGFIVLTCCRSDPKGRRGRVDLPAGSWRDLRTEARLGGGGEQVDSLLSGWPVAILEAEHG